MFCLGRFQRAGRPAAFWWRPAFFKKLKWRPVFSWWRPRTPCYNFYFATNVTVRGNRRGNYACVSLFYSTAFVIVIRLVYKNLCYWPIRIYFGMIATDCCITFIQWKARTQELLSRVRDRRCSLRYFDFGSLPFFKDWIYVLKASFMLLLLCIMSDTDSALGNFSCHRQGWQRFWIQRMRNSRCLCVVGYLRVYRRTLSIRLIA